MTDDGSDDESSGEPGHEIGYGNASVATRFRPGQSGNPKGRRKGNRNFKSHIRDELSKKVVLTQDGKRRVVTKVELMATQLVNSAVKGNLKNIEFLIRLMDLMEGGTGTEDHKSVLTNELRQKLADFFNPPDDEKP